MLVITLVVSGSCTLIRQQPLFLTGFIYTLLEIMANITVASGLNFICIITLIKTLFRIWEHEGHHCLAKEQFDRRRGYWWTRGLLTSNFFFFFDYTTCLSEHWDDLHVGSFEFLGRKNSILVCFCYSSWNTLSKAHHFLNNCSCQSVSGCGPVKPLSTSLSILFSHWQGSFFSGSRSHLASSQIQSQIQS